MRSCSPKRLWLALLLLSVAAGGARGQWQIVQNTSGVSAMCFKDGVIWAGGENLIFSTDTGRTWNTSLLGMPVGYDIAFLNKDTGMVATESGLLMTLDQGVSWNPIAPDDCGRIALGSSYMYGFDNNSSVFITSYDYGKTWNSSMIGVFGLCFTVANDGAIYAYSAAGTSPGILTGEMFVSTDEGLTWTQATGEADADCWSIASDSCDPSRLYLSNENSAWSGDGNSKIYLSSDRGASWNSVFSQHTPYLAGDLVSGSTVHLVRTFTNGILRSSDQGITWKNIGGPGAPVDQRATCIINDNIYFAADESGNIWETSNGGGDSVQYTRSSNSTFSLSTASLFEADTITCGSISRSVLFIRAGCSPPSVSSFSIVGDDSASFLATNLSDDSIVVTLHGIKSGNQIARLVLALNDGSRDTIMLEGYVKLPPNTLSASPAIVFASDTISCNSLTHSIMFSRSGCSPPSVSSWSIIGVDSASFQASNLSNDSIVVTLYGVKPGNQNAQLILYLDNGATDTVALVGYVNSTLTALTLSIPNVHTDTLGATVAVPIALNGLERAENVDLILHYDGSVDYLGSFSPLGVPLDVPGQRWAGRSELAITGAISSAVFGYAKFNVFNDSNDASFVGDAAYATFDSVTVLTQISPCEYSMPEAVTSTITTLSGCAIPMLSQFIHLGMEPLFSIVPNPANDNVWISSTDDVGEVTIEVYDMLSTQQSEISVQLNKADPIELLLPERSGVYNIVVRENSGTRTLRVVREN